MNTKTRPLLLIALLAGLMIGCGVATAPTVRPGPTNPSTPTPTSPPTFPPTPSPPPSIGPVTVTSPAQAAALVFASDERWGRMMPLRSDMVGQSSWYEAAADGTGFAVSITVGHGDCQAGCIEKHTWQYHVDTNGTVALVGESGDDIDAQPIAGGDGPAQITVHLRAGPTCPVVQIPPDPNCDDRPVTNAEVTLFDATGAEVDTSTSDDDGRVVFQVPTGAYYVVAQPVQGLMGTPEAQAVSVLGGDQAGLLFAYDTGIR